MNKDSREALKIVLRQWLARYVGPVRSEVVYCTIMPTKRQWKADFMVKNILIEINGGQWGEPVTCDKCGQPVHRKGKGGRLWRVMSMGGRHTRAGSYEEDLEKMNTASSNGFFVLQYTYEMLRDEKYIPDIKRILNDQDSKNKLRDTGQQALL